MSSKMQFSLLFLTLCVCVAKGGYGYHHEGSLLSLGNSAGTYGFTGLSTFPQRVVNPVSISHFPAVYSPVTYTPHYALPSYFSSYPAVVSAPGFILSDGLQFGGSNIPITTVDNQGNKFESTIPSNQEVSTSRPVNPPRPQNPPSTTTSGSESGDADTVVVESVS